MKTKKEIILETVAAYNLSNRSVLGKSSLCVYLGEDGRRCAFSRCCKDDSETYGLLRNHLRSPATDLLSWYSEESLLKPEYLGHEGEFWQSIQNLHDFIDNWNESGLSPQGELAVKRLLEGS